MKWGKVYRTELGIYNSVYKSVGKNGEKFVIE
jgi:hypothetical protein